MDSAIKIVLTLQALDKASAVIGQMANKANAKFEAMKKAAEKTAQGIALIGAGKKAFEFLKGPVMDFANQEKDAAKLQASMMGANGMLNADQWQKVKDLATGLGNEMKGTTGDMFNMITTLKNGGVEMETILSGAGKATAMLANVIEGDYSAIASSVAHLSEATNIAGKDMVSFADAIARTANIGVPVHEMEEAFAASSGALKQMNFQGLENSKSMANFFAMFIRQGASGQTVGTNLTAIFNELLNPEKMNKMNAAARQYGISLDLLGADGKLKSIEGMVTQFDKLGKLTTAQQFAVLKPLTGAEGFDDSMIKMLVNGGSTAFAEVARLSKEQADLAAKNKKINDALANQWEALTGTWTNVKAAFGASLKPTLDVLVKFLNNVTAKLQVFIEANPKIAQLAGTFIAVAGAGLYLAGLIKIFQGITIAMRIMGIAAMANPVLLIIMGIAFAAALLITYWDDIGPFFSMLWENLKANFLYALNFIKKLFLNFTPAGLIIKHWQPLTAWFGNMWEGVKTKFFAFNAWLYSFPKRLVQAGAKIVNSIWDGIKGRWAAFMAWWASKIQEIRNYLPFSPAKTGPLRDIHRIRLMETIATAIKPAPLLHAMDNSLNTVANISPNRTAGGGGAPVQITQHFSFAAGTSQKDMDSVANTMRQAVHRIIDERERNKQRVSF